MNFRQGWWPGRDVVRETFGGRSRPNPWAGGGGSRHSAHHYHCCEPHNAPLEFVGLRLNAPWRRRSFPKTTESYRPCRPEAASQLSSLSLPPWRGGPPPQSPSPQGPPEDPLNLHLVYDFQGERKWQSLHNLSPSPSSMSHRHTSDGYFNARHRLDREYAHFDARHIKFHAETFAHVQCFLRETSKHVNIYMRNSILGQLNARRMSWEAGAKRIKKISILLDIAVFMFKWNVLKLVSTWSITRTFRCGDFDACQILVMLYYRTANLSSLVATILRLVSLKQRFKKSSSILK